MTNIHPSAAVSAKAELGSNVSIGPFCIVEDDVVVGDGCRLDGRVTVKQGTRLGRDNAIGEGAVLGGRPQHLRANGNVGQLLIGDNNSIRENVTLHRALEKDAATTIGDNNMLMVNSHVAHDCHIGDGVIMANNVMCAGHVTVGSHAYLGGAAAVHQFCRVGAYTMIGGMCRLTLDAPPYVLLDGITSKVVGLNRIGLKRQGFTTDDMQQLKAAYQVIYRSGLGWSEVLAALKAEFPNGPAAAFHEFLTIGKRGFVQERREQRSVRLVRFPEQREPKKLRRAG